MNANYLLAGAIIALLLEATPSVAAPPPGPPAGTGDLHPTDATPSTRPSNDPDDLAVTAQIRRALAADRTLSTAGRQVQVSTNADAVTLRGAVAAQEHDKIESEARQFSGARQIINQLTVAEP
jgi:hypothetical protein